MTLIVTLASIIAVLLLISAVIFFDVPSLVRAASVADGSDERAHPTPGAPSLFVRCETQPSALPNLPQPPTPQTQQPVQPTEPPLTYAPTYPPATPEQTPTLPPYYDYDGWVCRGLDIGHEHIIALRSDGTVVASGSNTSGQCNVSGWSNIVEVAAGYTFSVGLRSDGTVVMAGSAESNLVSSSALAQWRNVVHISAHGCCVVGVDSAGRLLLEGGESERFTRFSVPDSIASRSDIVAVSAGNEHILVLFADGTAAAFGNNSTGACNVETWRDIVEICAGAGGSVGLRADGTVVYTGVDDHGQSDYNRLSNIAAICTKGWHLVYITKDGIVGVAGWSNDNRANVGNWNNMSSKRVVGVAASGWNTAAVFSDGTVALVGHTVLTGKANVSGWRNIVSNR